MVDRRLSLFTTIFILRIIILHTHENLIEFYSTFHSNKSNLIHKSFIKIMIIIQSNRKFYFDHFLMLNLMDLTGQNFNKKAASSPWTINFLCRSIHRSLKVFVNDKTITAHYSDRFGNVKNGRRGHRICKYQIKVNGKWHSYPPIAGMKLQNDL